MYEILMYSCLTLRLAAPNCGDKVYLCVHVHCVCVCLFVVLCTPCWLRCTCEILIYTLILRPWLSPSVEIGSTLNSVFMYVCTCMCVHVLCCVVQASSRLWSLLRVTHVGVGVVGSRSNRISATTYVSPTPSLSPPFLIINWNLYTHTLGCPTMCCI